jgi:oxygen-independent coproporphyrinogen-3 oxidase
MHLYIHIPFCKQACYYCDFHFSTRLQQKEKVVDAICKEIVLQKSYLKEKKLQTIYFGGGTPSLLSGNDFEKIFSAISSIFDLSALEETTIETNPDDISLEAINTWKAFEINRVSLGIQTFNEELLRFMNRAHNSLQSFEAVQLLQSNFSNNLTVDLIYAKNGGDFSNQKHNEILQKDLKIIQDFNLNHISAYNLTIEDSTVFGKWLKQKKIAPIGEDYAAEQFEILVEGLKKQGFVQYEISNFTKNDTFAIHNSSYWKNEEYLGIGPSAHSYNLESRQANVSNNTQYIMEIEKGKIPFKLEQLTVSEKINDYLFCGLRTIWGVDLNKISQMSEDVPSSFWDTLEKQKSQNFIFQNENTIRITDQGRIFSDKIASDLFWD